MSDILSINAGEVWRKSGMVAKASGGPITAGTVNYYLLALTGANAGKWWKNTDQTWAVAETANAMAHKADGNWTIELAASPFADGVIYLEYAKESGDLHVAAEGRLLRGTTGVNVTHVGGTEQTPGDLAALIGAPAGASIAADIAVKTGYKLAADGLDSITATEVTAKPTNFREWLQWLIQVAKSGTLTATTKIVRTEAGATVTTQTVSDDGTTETIGPPS